MTAQVQDGYENPDGHTILFIEPLSQNPDIQQLTEARRLIYLLERLSADSHWAHQASGLRGALLRAVESEQTPAERQPFLQGLISSGYATLERAARDIRTPELQALLQNYSDTGK